MILDWINVIKTNNCIYDLQIYIKQNLIFLNEDLRDNFEKIYTLLHSARIDWVSGKRYNSKDSFERSNSIIKNDIDPLMDIIENLIKEKLKFYKAI